MLRRINDGGKRIKKNNKGFIFLIIILLAIILGMGIYIAYDKGIIFASVEKETNKNKNEDKVESNEKNNDHEEVKELDLSKCLNNSQVNYSNASDVAGNYGLSMEINPDKKSISLKIDWAIFGPLSSATAWVEEVKTYQITGFSKNINAVFVGDLGQSATGITLFYLMSDKTIEYTPMFNRKLDSQNNSYYEMNYSYDYSPDGKITNSYFSTKGTINGVNDVVKLYTADASNGAGWKTTIAAKTDGSFYDLGALINNN